MNGVLGQNMASKWVWIPLEDGLRHLGSKVGLQSHNPRRVRDVVKVLPGVCLVVTEELLRCSGSPTTIRKAQF